MLRRFSASGLALVMIAIIALRFPALAFCLCDHHLILNDGTCCVEAPVPPDSCDCCVEKTDPAKPVPCDDCVIVLSVDPGDFFWLNHQFSPATVIGSPIILPVGLQDDSLPPSQPISLAGQIRGSPPWRASAPRSRSQVLRL